MACENQMDALISYGSGALSASRRETLERHLNDCEICRRAVDARKTVWDALDAYRAFEPSGDFDRRLYARIAEEARQPWWRIPLSRYFTPFGFRAAAPVAAACIAICAAFIFRVPEPAPARPVAVEHRINVDQVERTLDDLDMLKQLTVFSVDKEEAPAQASQS